MPKTEPWVEERVQTMGRPVVAVGHDHNSVEVRLEDTDGDEMSCWMTPKQVDQLIAALTLAKDRVVAIEEKS